MRGHFRAPASNATRQVRRSLGAAILLLTALVAAAGALGAVEKEQERAPRVRARPKVEAAAPRSMEGGTPRVSRSGTGTLASEPRSGTEKASATRTRRPVVAPAASARLEPLHQGPIVGRTHATDTLAVPTNPKTADYAAPASSSAGMLARSSTSGELAIFRNTVVTNSGSAVVEPTAANDRNGILATGNLYAAVSTDNGLTFSTDLLDPTDGELYDGACCDQVAYAVDRGSYSLVFWLVQDRYSASAQKNALRLHLFKGRSDLLAGRDECTWTFEPSDFDLDAKTWLDFNQVSHTAKYLYLTTNVRDADKASDPSDTSKHPRVGALIFRIALDDIDDDCQVPYRYWYEEGNAYISPVQNAGSTMYLATRVYDFLEGDNLRIYSILDSSNTLEHKDKDIQNYKDIEGNCPLPDGNDPCKKQHEGRMSGFRSGSTIGWLWMADEDGQFPFPHVRVAVFETGSKDKILEHQIWSDEFAWQLPSVGVNSEGHLGVILYAMGGGRFPKAQVFMRTDPRSWSGIQMKGIANSTSGVDVWGHYGSVRPYGNCPETFLGSAYTSEGGLQKGRLVWFGLEGSGCEDLVTTAVSAPGGSFDSGDLVDITTTVQNQGSDPSPASFLGYYLSQDQSLDDGDIRFTSTRATNALDPVAKHTLTATIALPSTRALVRDYYVIACADDLETVSEVTDTNNCAVSSETLSVRASLTPVRKKVIP